MMVANKRKKTNIALKLLILTMKEREDVCSSIGLLGTVATFCQRNNIHPVILSSDVESVASALKASGLSALATSVCKNYDIPVIGTVDSHSKFISVGRYDLKMPYSSRMKTQKPEAMIIEVIKDTERVTSRHILFGNDDSVTDFASGTLERYSPCGGVTAAPSEVTIAGDYRSPSKKEISSWKERIYEC